MSKGEIRKRGPVTEYRPDEDDLKGGSDHSVQSEALGAEGSDDLASGGATSGRAAGRINDLDDRRGGWPGPTR